MKLKISFIGSGNVATQLAVALDRQGHQIQQVISKTEAHAYELARKFGAFYSSQISKLQGDSDIIFLCVPDEEIAPIAKELQHTNAICVHCSGTTPMEVFGSHKAYGVFYPLQTFSKSRTANWLDVPILIEASDFEHLKQLRILADSISNKVVEANSAERKGYHLAAVWASNFSNHMYAVAEHLLRAQKLPFDLLKPLMLETTAKAVEMNPVQAQTGPAARKDRKTMQEHLALMDDPKLKMLYQAISDSIQRASEEWSQNRSE